MKRIVLVIFLFVTVTGAAQISFRVKQDSTSRIFLGGGFEWINFYTIRPPDNHYGISIGYAPITFNFDIRGNIAEFGTDRSLSLSFAPAPGVSVLNGSSGTMVVVNAPLFLRYNYGFTATRRATKERGLSVGAGPALNLFYFFGESGKSYTTLSGDVQLTWQKTNDVGRKRYSYFRFGYQPAAADQPYAGIHLNFGRGWLF